MQDLVMSSCFNLKISLPNTADGMDSFLKTWILPKQAENGKGLSQGVWARCHKQRAYKSNVTNAP